MFNCTVHVVRVVYVNDVFYYNWIRSLKPLVTYSIHFKLDVKKTKKHTTKLEKTKSCLPVFVLFYLNCVEKIMCWAFVEVKLFLCD